MTSSMIDKMALLARARKADAERRRRAAPAKPGRAAKPGAPDFADLPEYRMLKTQAAAADMFGVESPFFRPHEARAGAVTTIAGREVANFASYDYLGFNSHPAVAAAAKGAIDQYGVSASASRLVGGEKPLHREFEAALAGHYGVDDALVFVSGHATNVATIGELCGPKDIVIYDELIHNSVLVGARLSGAARRGFAHNDMDALESILKGARGGFERALIVVEGLYSMDGDFPDLPRLIALKREYAAWLMVDEAHALGVLGDGGRGVAEHFGIDPRKVDIWMGTLSKTLAACGGFIAGSHALVELLKLQASSFVYSVGMAPPVAAAGLAALTLLPGAGERVARLQENGRHFLHAARAAGLDTGLSAGYAVAPVMIGDPLRATRLCALLLERGFNVLPVIYPAVPMNASRLRFFLTSEHEKSQIDAVIAATSEVLDGLVKDNFGAGGLMTGKLAPRRHHGE